MAENALQAFLLDLMDNPDGDAGNRKETVETYKPYVMQKGSDGKPTATVANKNKGADTNERKSSAGDRGYRPYSARPVPPGSKGAGEKTRTFRGKKQAREPEKADRKVTQTRQRAAYSEPPSQEASARPTTPATSTTPAAGAQQAVQTQANPEVQRL